MHHPFRDGTAVPLGTTGYPFLRAITDIWELFLRNFARLSSIRCGSSATYPPPPPSYKANQVTCCACRKYKALFFPRLKRSLPSCLKCSPRDSGVSSSYVKSWKAFTTPGSTSFVHADDGKVYRTSSKNQHKCIKRSTQAAAQSHVGPWKAFVTHRGPSTSFMHTGQREISSVKL